MLRVLPLKRNTADIEKLASLKHAIGKIHKEYRLIYEDFGKQVVQVWIRSIFTNALSRRFLERHYPDISRRFNELVDLTDLNSLKA
jgi:hypothetical protein